MEETLDLEVVYALAWDNFGTRADLEDIETDADLLRSIAPLLGCFVEDNHEILPNLEDLKIGHRSIYQDLNLCWALDLCQDIWRLLDIASEDYHNPSHTHHLLVRIPADLSSEDTVFLEAVEDF